VPRSFLTGKLFSPLRRFILGQGAVVAMHRFRDRRLVFYRDAVLQEAVIMTFCKGTSDESIELSWSDAGEDILSRKSRRVPISRVLDASDPDYGIHIPAGPAEAEAPPFWVEGQPLIPAQYSVSTGPVVDFRVEPPLVHEGGQRHIPVIGAEVFASLSAPRRSRPRYALPHALKSNQIFSTGYFVIIKRLSPSEQRPRLRAIAFDATGDEYLDGVAFENHVNVVHADRCGLSRVLAEELAEELSSPSVARQFAEISGSTQVNVSDLKRLRRRGKE